MFRPIRKRKNEIDRNAVETLLNESPFNSIGVVELFGAEKFPIVKETLNTLHKPLSE